MIHQLPCDIDYIVIDCCVRKSNVAGQRGRGQWPAKTERRSGEDDGMKTMEQQKEENIGHACFLLFKLKILIFRFLIYIIQNFNCHVLHISGIN
jgi:hypothetical protein